MFTSVYSDPNGIYSTYWEMRLHLFRKTFIHNVASLDKKPFRKQTGANDLITPGKQKISHYAISEHTHTQSGVTCSDSSLLLSNWGGWARKRLRRTAHLRPRYPDTRYSTIIMAACTTRPRRLITFLGKYVVHPLPAQPEVRTHLYWPTTSGISRVRELDDRNLAPECTWRCPTFTGIHVSQQTAWLNLKLDGEQGWYLL